MLKTHVVADIFICNTEFSLVIPQNKCFHFEVSFNVLAKKCYCDLSSKDLSLGSAVVQW